jgi:CubicO group peptidase (beta-lactamase class C family)
MLIHFLFNFHKSGIDKKIIRFIIVLVGAMFVLWDWAPRFSFSDQDVETRIRRVENGILGAVQIKDRPMRIYSIGERMEHYGVPGLALAVVNNGRVEWARGYGVAESGTDKKVTAATLFQAASISKPLAALAALKLVDQNKLTLDEPVNRWLRSWLIPPHEWTDEESVSLRRILTHSAGLTVHGFPGYASHETVPDLIQVLNGEGNTDPIRVDIKPGLRFRYSGGGYTILQLLLEDVSGKPFPVLLRNEILLPLGMRESAYDQPLSPGRAGQAATGYRTNGLPVTGKYHTYPEMAAAGLWTTPADLCRYVIDVQRSLSGKWNPVISKQMTEAMLKPGKNGWGLGPAIQGKEETLRFSHGGGNEGFRCHVVGYAHTGQGAAVMTNSDNGGQILQEILLGIAREYEWQDYKPEIITAYEVDPEVFQDYTGRYRFKDMDFEFTIEAEEGRLMVIQGGRRSELIPTNKDVFYYLDDGFVIQFKRDKKGQVKEVVIPGDRRAARLSNKED